MAHKTFTPIPRSGKQPREIVALSENIEQLMGARGDKLDSALTWRDLAALGYIKVPKRAGSKELATISAPTLPEGIEATPTIEPPTQPVGVVVAAAQIQNIIAWDRPLFYGYSYTEVWRSSADDYGLAVRIGTSSIAMYSDTHNNENFFYWVRHVNALNIVSPLNATAGIAPSGSIDDIAGKLEVTQVGALAADRIFASVGSIADLIVGDGHILNAMIGQVIKSDNSVPGSVGWKINKDGTAEFLSIIARGDIEATRIKADVVNVINTLMLQDQAVTIPTAYFAAGAQTISSGWSTVAQVSYDSSGAPVFINYSNDAKNPQQQQGRQFRILVNGSTKLTTGIRGWTYTSNPLEMTDTFDALIYRYAGGAAGWMSFQIQARTTLSSCILANRSLSMLEVKK